MKKYIEGTKLVPHTTFVNDTIMEEVRYIIIQAAENSVLTASVFFGNINIVEETISI